MASSLKQQVRSAIKRGDTELALELLKSLENPKPPNPQRVSYLNRPYYNSKLRYET
jgi:hypothetical protein